LHAVKGEYRETIHFPETEPLVARITLENSKKSRKKPRFMRRSHRGGAEKTGD